MSRRSDITILGRKTQRMFSDRVFSVGARLVAGLLLVSMIVLVVRLCFFSDIDYPYGSLTFPLLLCLAYLCIQLVPSNYRSSRVAYVFGGIAIGAGTIGLVGSRAGFATVGALTGALLGGLIADGMAAGVVDATLAATVLFAGLLALTTPYPHSEAFGGSLAIPGGALGASIIWMCRLPRGSRRVSLALAGAAFFAGLWVIFGPRYALGGHMAIAAWFLGASILGMCWGSRRSHSADAPACSSRSESAVGLRTDDRTLAAHATTSHTEDPARRRSRRTVRRIMIVVVCCAFVLGALRRDAKGVLHGITTLLVLAGGPASGVILQRRWGGSGILGGTVAGAASGFVSAGGVYAWFYLNPQLGALQEPLKQIINAAVISAADGVIIGVLIWGVMLTDRRSDENGGIFHRFEPPSSATAGEQARHRPRLLLGILAGATVYLVEIDLAGTLTASGYSLMFAAWILLLVAFGYDLVRIPIRALTFVFGSLRSRQP